MKLNGKVPGVSLDLRKLGNEIAAAGIVLGDLGTAGDELVTYDQEGHTIPDLPAAVAPILAAHVPDPPAPTRDELLVAALEAPKAALAQAATLDEVKAIFSATLDGLSTALVPARQPDVPEAEGEGAGVVDRTRFA